MAVHHVGCSAVAVPVRRDVQAHLVRCVGDRPADLTFREVAEVAALGWEQPSGRADAFLGAPFVHGVDEPVRHRQHRVVVAFAEDR